MTDSSLSQVSALVQFVDGTQAAWDSTDVPVPNGVVVYAFDTTAIKIGDGVTLYKDLSTIIKLRDILGLEALVNTKAPIIDAQLAGRPSGPTAPSGTTTNQLATCAFVSTAVASVIQALAQITGNVLLSSADTSPGFLLNKFRPGTGIRFVTDMNNGNELVTINGVAPAAGNNIVITQTVNNGVTTETINAPTLAPGDGINITNTTGSNGLVTETISAIVPGLAAGSGITITPTQLAGKNVLQIATSLVLGALAAKSTITSGDISAGAVNVAACDPSVLAYDIPFMAGFNASLAGADLAVQSYAEMVIPRNLTPLAAIGYIDTPADAAVIVDILKNGTSIYTTKPQFAAGANAITDGVLVNNVTFTTNDRLSFKVNQIGSSTKGQKLRFTLKMKVS